MAFTKEDFTEDELILLKMAFGMLDVAVEKEYEFFYGRDHRNDLYYLKEKLGIYDVLEGWLRLSQNRAIF